MTEAKELAAAERCSLFLLDKHTGELVSKVFDGNEVMNLFWDVDSTLNIRNCIRKQDARGKQFDG